MPSIRQSIRSSTASKRPTSAIADGQIALNTASGTPGMFFKDSAGNIVKAGPAHYGATAPNSSPAVGGSTGNSFGETWLDSSLTPAGWKIWNGSAWVNATPLSSDTVQGLVELATNAETQAGVDTARAVTAAGLQSKVSDSISTTSASGIASSTAVKTAYDLANAALPKTGGIITGNLEIGSTGSFTFEGSTADAFETTLDVVDPTADRTITFPNITGTVVTTGDTGTVTSTMILDGTILNADINASAAIVDTKLATIATSGKVSNSATTATSGNTASAIVARDASGNFTAGTITATLIGNASTVTTNANLTGHVTSVGNAAVLGSFTSAQLATALTDETGSGASVFATSPSLTTPSIGAATGTSLSATGAAGFLTRAAATQDGVEVIGRAGGTTSWKATITPTTLTANRTITLPDTTGTVVTTGDTGTVTSTMLLDGTILNADVNASAAIAGTKISPDFGSQNVVTTGTATAASLSPTGSSVPTNGVYLPSANNVAISTNGTGRLYINSNGDIGLGTSSPDVFGRFYTRAIGLSSSGSTSLQINSATGSSAIIDLGVNSARTAGITSNVTETSFSTLTATPIILGTNGSEKLRITSAGLVGLGTSSPTNTAGFSKQMEIAGTLPCLTLNQNDTGFTTRKYSLAVNANGDFGVWDNTPSAYRFYINSSGNVGIGTTSPTASLVCNGHIQIINTTVPSSGAGLELSYGQINASRTSQQSYNRTGSAYLGADYDALDYRWYISGSLKATIDTSGRLLVGTSSQLIANRSLQVYSSSGAVAVFKSDSAATESVNIWNSATSGNNIFLEFDSETSVTARGTIDYNRSAGQVRYNVTSDRRLKSDIEDASSALNILDQIKVRSYTWTETGYNIPHGFIAQELNEAVPDAVKVGDDGDEVVDTWAVDNAKLVPVLTKALQEAIAEIETLKDRVAALEAS
jgi:hypothetical protein